MAIDKEFYNEASASKLGWLPSWFIPGYTFFDKKLTSAIKSFQKEMGLLDDGMCGPTTYRRILAKVESEHEFVGPPWTPTDSDVLWYNDQPIKINWPADKVHTFKDEGFPFEISEGLRKQSKKRTVKSFVAHWDVCLNSISCAKVLKQRNVSVHFMIDNDGSIIQLHDMNDICWHAGVSKVNDTSVGVEISNAYYVKYNSWYEKNGFGKRELVSDAKVNGNTLETHTDFYPIQKLALKALIEAISIGLNIPIVVPGNKDGYDNEAASGKFNGIMNHYNCNKKKIDCGGLDLEKLIKN